MMTQVMMPITTYYENYYTPIAPTVTDDTACVILTLTETATLTVSGPLERF